MSANKPHHFDDEIRICKWVYCLRCGLVALNNAASIKAMHKPCPDNPEDKR